MGVRRPVAAARQLVLDLRRDPSLAVDDFLVSPSNADAFDLVDRWPAWSTPTLLLIGPPGSGKTHLGMVWARLAGAHIAVVEDMRDPAALASHEAVVLDDCESLARDEAALFHFVNLMRERGGWLLVTAQRAPDRWGLCTPDLLSRLRLYPQVTMGSPSPDLVRAVLVKLFDDRQIRTDEDLIAYAALHLDQSLDAARMFVQVVDEASLAVGRKITRALAATTIAALYADSREDLPSPPERHEDPQGPT